MFEKCRQVFPSIIERLISSAKESKNIVKGSVYFTSHKYKLQYAILSNLGDFVLNLNFIERDMYTVLNAVAHYLDITQPIELQVFHKYVVEANDYSFNIHLFIYIYL